MGPGGRLGLFALLWAVLAGGSASSWIIGAPTVVFATWMSLRLSAASDASGRRGMTPSGLLGFVPLFLLESLRGGLDVAGRVMRPQLRIQPGFHAYAPRLRDPVARIVFLDSISLLPGTLSADLRDDIIQVHALDTASDLDPELERLERAVARLFGETLEETAA
ncbi:MAG: cation transporter [Planctomycetes bacterium]|nr:cation transporter [Planctomycetota bacterium]